MLVWIDLEMTGLNPNKDKIIEIAIIITNNDLKIMSDNIVINIYQPNNIICSMDSWNKNIHYKNGLIDKVKSSKINEQQAEKIILNFLKLWVPPQTAPMCGNSICQDRRFLYNYMPNLENYFHYRNIDVSTIKELVKIWHPQIYKNFSKIKTHHAIDDIYESIKELKFYKKFIFCL
ncbi:oligoribonuclease [Enterobacteriaceae endosymbiont of Neohaemonia nigricornis]|uniref:oligoribonuclease n=1 Tax=Enterobacteriaceae endosymbiont of Neohaemonia nigricornis TaxID=2675792 RepID=UPI0014492DC7|nr:oligoribonuclease [Enterobacteriaceae endosymbiont of Neohaemonia nigricornis]QJC30622.1 oligoribonuclease [Enterobacteriaceae endosymbiont of Neohaemonia nigricornis]